MKLQLPVLVRRDPGARWRVSTLAGPECVREGPVLERVKADVAREVERAVAAAPPGEVALWLAAPPGRIERIPLAIDARPPGGKRERVRGRFGAHVRPAPPPLEGSIVTIPAADGIALHVRPGDDLAVEVERALARRYAEDPEGLAAIATEGTERLHLLDVEVDAPALVERAREDDEVSLRALLGGDHAPRRKRAKEELARGETLLEVGIDLTAEARDGRLAGSFGRDAEAREVFRALTEGPVRAVLLVGEPGTGKTALVEEVARRLAERQAALGLPRLRGSLFSVNAGRLIAGMRYVGEWQARTIALAEEAAELGAMIHADSLPELMNAARGGARERTTVGRVLEPFVASGAVAIVAEATPAAFDRCAEWDRPFVDLFQVVRLREPPPAESLAIALRAVREVEARVPVAFDPVAVRTALDLLRRFVPYEAFPGKAVRFLRRLAAENAVRWSPGGPMAARFIGVLEVVHGFARTFGVADAILDDAMTYHLGGVRELLTAHVCGQPEAVEAIVDVVAMLKAGLKDPERPVAALLFAGPTGVGKTESAKALASLLFGSEERLIRFDLNECGDPDAAERLAGSPREPEGELTRALREQPFAVVLLDEVEKAHPAVHDLLLQLLGEGRLTDALGRTTDARNAVFVLTTNLGAECAGKEMGFRPEDAAAQYRRAIEDFFRPELVNRFDRIVAFRPLSREALRAIAGREVAALLAREGVARRGLYAEAEDALLDLVVDEGATPGTGARGLKRAVERRLAGPLAALLAARPDAANLVLALRRGEAPGEVAIDVEEIEGIGPVEAGPRADDLDPLAELPHGEQVRALEERFAALERSAERAALGRALVDIAMHPEDLAPGVSERLDALEAEIHLAREEIEALGRKRGEGGVIERVLWPDDVPAPHELRPFPAPEVRLDWTRTPPPFAERLRRARRRIAKIEAFLALAQRPAEPLLLEIRPVGRASVGWAWALGAHYRRFFARHGILAQAAASERGDAIAVLVFAPGAAEWLAGEAGIHERRLGGAAGAVYRPELARVSVGGARGPSRVVRKYIAESFVHDVDLGCSAPAALARGDEVEMGAEFERPFEEILTARLLAATAPEKQDETTDFTD